MKGNQGSDIIKLFIILAGLAQFVAARGSLSYGNHTNACNVTVTDDDPTDDDNGQPIPADCIVPAADTSVPAWGIALIAVAALVSTAFIGMLVYCTLCKKRSIATEAQHDKKERLLDELQAVFGNTLTLEVKDPSGTFIVEMPEERFNIAQINNEDPGKAVEMVELLLERKRNDSAAATSPELG
jgi:hypothetical protein